MPQPFKEKYSAEQRRALATAYEDRRIKPYRRVIELAERGELEPGLPAFTVDGGPSYVADLVRKLRRTRAAEHTSELAKQPPRDAIETLRRRLVTVAEQEVEALEKVKRGERDPERLRQLARAIREAAAIPGPTDPTPPKPGHQGKDQTTGRTEGVTRGGIAGGVLAQAHRTAPEPAINAHDGATAPDHTPSEPTHGQTHTATHDHDTESQPINAADHDSPGAWARAEFAALSGAPEEG